MYNKSIFTKIDWLSIIFEDNSFNHILEFLRLDPSLYVSEFLRGQGEMSQGLEQKKFFSFEGVNIQVNAADIIGNGTEDTFEQIFSKIRLDISGHGLDFLRSTGLCVDDYFRNYDAYPQPFHLTRCDFAFDLIDYHQTFVDDLIDFCENNITPSGRICLLHQKNGVKCSVRKFDQKTVYLGATGSNQLLRVYDKRLQFIDRNTGLYKHDNPYNNPDSWIRIELQTRREVSMKLLFGNVEGNSSKYYWFSLFRYIYETYCFVDYVGTTKQNRKPADFWLNLYDWSEVATIIQNENCVSFVPYVYRVQSDFYANILRMLRWFAVAGTRSNVQDVINKSLHDLFNYGDPRVERRRSAFLDQLNTLLASDAITISDDPGCDFGFYRDCGKLFFKF